MQKESSSGRGPRAAARGKVPARNHEKNIHAEPSGTTMNRADGSDMRQFDRLRNDSAEGEPRRGDAEFSTVECDGRHRSASRAEAGAVFSTVRQNRVETSGPRFRIAAREIAASGVGFQGAKTTTRAR